MYNPFSLVNKTILITGASSGIGKAVAVECSKMGASVVITGRNEERLNETQSLIDGSVLSIRCDLTKDDELNALIESLPVLQGVVINAGIGKLTPVKKIKESDLSEILQTNTTSSIMLLQKLLNNKKLLSGASVVFTSSVSALGQTAIGNAMYTASKGAVSAFVKVAALELASRGIRVNAICPGEVRTPLIEGNDLMSGDIEEGLKRYPLGRYGEPIDIALSMVYLLSDASSWTTGINLIVDGGLTIRA